MAVTDPDAPPHARASQIIVPTDTPGFDARPQHPGHGRRRRGLRQPLREVRFEGCRVPVEQLARRGGRRLRASRRSASGPGRIHHCMRWIGICERAFDLLCRRARDAQDRARRGARPAADRCRRWIAESRAEIDAARLMVLHAAWTIEAEGSRAARERGLADQVLRRRRARPACSTARSRCTARSASPTTPCSPTSTATSAARASTTAPTRCTRRGGARGAEAPTAWTSRSSGAGDAWGSTKRGPVRAGEELDAARLAGIPGASSVPARTATALEVEQFPGGHSNLTYLVRMRRPRVRAAPAAGRRAGRSRRTTWGASTACCRASPPSTRRRRGRSRPARTCDVLGAPFYLMERVPRRHPATPPPRRADADPTWRAASASRSSTRSASCTRSTSRRGPRRASASRRATSSARSRGWTERYRARPDRRHPRGGACRALARRPAWPDGAAGAHPQRLQVRQPGARPGRTSTRIAAVLDWEMATIGDPLMDLGTVARLLGGARTTRPRSCAAARSRPHRAAGHADARRGRRALRAGAGAATSTRSSFYYVFGLFKIAVIAQQIYYRFQRGLTNDPRFGRLGAVVAACGETAEAAIARRRIDRLTS